MVTRLQKPAIDCIQLVTDIVNERRGGKNAAYFAGIADEWRERVQSYEDRSGSPEHVGKWTEIEPRKGVFLNLYAHPKGGSAQGEALRHLRRRDGLVYCPACGEPGTPNTLDHYLPKSVYPHFCVTPLNLFPMCDACQTLKGSKTGDHLNARYFIHPYYDDFVREQVLGLTIDPPFDTPNFSLVPCVGLSDDESALVACHVRELNIDGRFADYFVAQHRRLLRQVDSLRRSDQDVRASLTAFRDAIAPFGKNVWDHIFYEATLANVALMAYLEGAELPPYL